MATWVKCREWLDLGDRGDVLHINLDNVAYMVGGNDQTSLFMVGMSDENALQVLEAPDEIIKQSVSGGGR